MELKEKKKLLIFLIFFILIYNHFWFAEKITDFNYIKYFEFSYLDNRLERSLFFSNILDLFIYIFDYKIKAFISGFLYLIYIFSNLAIIQYRRHIYNFFKNIYNNSVNKIFEKI